MPVPDVTVLIAATAAATAVSVTVLMTPATFLSSRT
jgi:hypothetical protein